MHKRKIALAAIIALLATAGASHAQQTITCPGSAPFSLQAPAGWQFNGPSPALPLVRVFLGPYLYCSYAATPSIGGNLIKLLPAGCKAGPNFQNGACVPGANGPAYCAISCPATARR